MNIRNLFLGAAIILSMANVHAQVTVVHSDTCGSNLTWTLYSDSILTIRGNG